MINLLFLVSASILMAFNLVYVIRKFRNWNAFAELSAKHPRMRKMGLLYLALLMGFSVGYAALTVIWILNQRYNLANADIIVQILFWGAVFVKISNDNLFLLLQTFERDKMYQISNLEMSLDAYINSIPGGVHHCITDPEFSVLYVSEGFTSITGYDVDDINTLYNGKYIEMCYDDEDRKVFLSAIKGIVSNHSSTTIIYKMRRKDGEFIWVSENMKAVQDYLGKTHIFAVLTDITQEKKLADIDGLTGLFNKRTFCSLAKDYLDTNPDENVGLFMIDLNDFKMVNDTYGHPVGDIAIKKTADFLRLALVEKDCIIGRVGGDEFMVLVKKVASREELDELSNAMCRSFKILLPEIEQAEPISGSIGYVFASASEDFEEIYHRADQAMYQEKAMRSCH